MVIDETFCGTKNDLEETKPPNSVGKEPELGGSTDVGTTDGTDPDNPMLVTGGGVYNHSPPPGSPGGPPPGSPPSSWEDTPIGSLNDFEDSTTTGVTVVDLNGDGVEDIIVTTVDGKSNQIYLSPPDGDWSKVDPTPIGPPSGERENLEYEDSHTTDVKVIDVNGDNVPDLVITNRGTPNEIFLGDPERPGVYDGPPATFGNDGEDTMDVEVVDIDGDGTLDIVVANYGQRNMIYYGDSELPPGGVPNFDEFQSPVGPYADKTTSVTIGLVNGDDKPDIVFGNDGTADLIVMNPTPFTRDLSNVKSDAIPGAR